MGWISDVGQAAHDHQTAFLLLSARFSLFPLTTLSSLSPSLAVFTSIHTLAYTFSLFISSSLKDHSQHILSTSLTLVTLVALAVTLHFSSLLFSSHECNKNLSRELKYFNKLAHTPVPIIHSQDTWYSILYTHNPHSLDHIPADLSNIDIPNQFKPGI